MFKKIISLTAVCFLAISCSKSNDIPACSNEISNAFRIFILALELNEDVVVKLNIFKNAIGSSACRHKEESGVGPSGSGGGSGGPDGASTELILTAAFAEGLVTQKATAAQPVVIPEREKLAYDFKEFKINTDLQVELEVAYGSGAGRGADSYFGDGSSGNGNDGSRSSSDEILIKEREAIKAQLNLIQSNPVITALIKKVGVTQLRILNPYTNSRTAAYLDTVLYAETKDAPKFIRLNVGLSSDEEQIIEVLEMALIEPKEKDEKKLPTPKSPEMDPLIYEKSKDKSKESKEVPRIETDYPKLKGVREQFQDNISELKSNPEVDKIRENSLDNIELNESEQQPQ